MPHRFRDRLGHGEVRLVAEVDVVRDQEGTRPHCRSPGGGVQRGVTEVRPARGIRADLVTQSLEFTATHVGEVLALGPRGRALVEVDRNPQLRGRPRA